MRFNRNGSFGSRAQALASAATALINDDTSGGMPAPGEQTADGQPATADGTQADPPAAGPTGGTPEGENKDDAEQGGDKSGVGDGASVEPGSSQSPPPAPGEAETAQSVAEHHAAGRAQMAERIETVFAHENCTGREAAAATLLAADLPADKIIASLGKLPKGGAANAMLDRLASQAGSAPVVSPGAAPADDSKASTDVWGNAHKKAGLTK